MFQVGDKIVYPMYGAGIVEELEEKEKDGIYEKYYVINISNGNLKIKLSAKRAPNMGLREVAKKSEVIEAIKMAAEKEIEMPDNWNQRYKDNLERIRTGQILQVAQVVKTLNTREKRRGLSGVEKKMLNNARQIIVSEIVLSHDIVKEKAEELLANLLLNC